MFKKKVVHTPVVIQMDIVECGAAALNMILGYFGKWIPLDTIRSDCGVSRDGCTAYSIVEAAKSYGLEIKAKKYGSEALHDKAEFPCIVHYGFNHFVVLKGFKRNKVYINDPAKGAIVVNKDTFSKHYTGVCLMFKPGKDFVKSGKKPKAIFNILKTIKSNCSIFLFLSIMSLMIAFFGIVQPLLDRFALDWLISKNNVPVLFNIFIFAFFVYLVFKILYEFINIIYQNRINAKLDITHSVGFVWKILHLPLLFFQERTSGDMLNRKNISKKIINDILNTFAPMFFNVLQLIFYFFIMLNYNCPLTLIGAGSIIFNLILSKILNKHILNYSRILANDIASLEGYTINSISMIESVKSSGAENSQFQLWARIQANYNNDNIKVRKFVSYYSFIPKLINGLSGVIITALGVYFIIKGMFTVGMLAAFSGFMQLLSKPATYFISVGQKLQSMNADMERLRNVMDSKEDLYSYGHKDFEDNKIYKKLKGNIHIKDVTFSYNKLLDPVISNFSLDIKEGESIAIVGSSGCGKSTLSRLLCGFYLPDLGNIYYDNKEIKDIEKGVFKSSVALVDQDIYLFEDTIKNNITMWDDTIEENEIISSCKDAQIFQEISMWHEGFNRILSENGNNLSGGQKQKLEIARALVIHPSILIMDEATSALDSVTEQKIVNAIKKRNITSIIIAHRLSTIRSCDKIIVLNQGKIVEIGSHDELIKINGHYKELVLND